MSAQPLNAGEKAAREARRNWDIDAGPVGELLDVAEERQSVPVLIERFGDEKIAGVLLRRADGDSFIAINADHGAVRQRFTLAHELGHIHMRHQPRVERSEDLFGPKRSHNPQEVEANYFAAELLAPRAAITSWLEDRDLLQRADEPETVVQLALEFGVSFPTAAYRLTRSGAIGRRAKERLLEELATRGGELIRLHAAHRLMDTIESVWRSSDYPRVPRRTVSYAERARAAGLLDQEEYKAIVAKQPDLDFADWMT